MRSIPAALTWEMLERGKWNFLGAFLVGNALPMIVLAALQQDGVIDPEDRSMITIHVTMLLLNFVIFGGTISAALGNPSRLYAFPASTPAIVAWQLLPAMTAMALACLLTTAAFNALFKLDWPLWGPALFMPVALATFAACFWLTEKSPWHLLALGIPLASVVGVWFYSRYGLIFYPQSVRMWREVTAVEVVTMLATAGIAYYAAVVGVARSRCGEFLKTPGFFRWLGRVLDPAPAVGLPFRTPAQAQFWFEWRQKGWAMPAVVLVALPVGFVLWILSNRNPQELFDGGLGAGGFLTVGGMLVGLFFGNAGPADGKLEMGHFLATRPMTSTDMSRTMLKTAGISMLLAWVMWAVAFLALYAILLLAHVDPRPQLPRELGWWYFPATLLGSWLALTLLATLAQAGRPMLCMILFCGVPGFFIGSLLFCKYALSPEAQTQFTRAATTAGGAFVILGTAWAFVAARRRSLIGSPTVWSAAGIWGGLCTLVVLYWSLHRNQVHAVPLPVYVLVIGLLALVVFPLAAAPLALAWNRNR